MKIRLLAVLLALPLVAFDCGEEQKVQQCPYACTLHVRGAVTEDLCCVAVAYDYSQMDPMITEWLFMLTGFRSDMFDEAAMVGVFFEGRPALATTYGWDADVCSTQITSGVEARFTGSTTTPPYEVVMTHSAYSGLGTGALSLTFTAIPPASAVDEELLGVHGTLTGTLPADELAPDPLAPPVTFSATF